MGGEGNLKHVVHKRVHLERHQPAARKRLGYLEKKKDYVKRAKDFHKKEKAIKDLQRKAFFKNDDEFAFSMLNHTIVKGQTRKKHKNAPEDEIRLAEDQDARYIGMREQMDKRAIERQADNLHFLDAPKPNKHVLFIDKDDEGAAPSSSSARPKKKKKDLSAFDVAAHLDTHPALLGKQSNRLRRDQLDGKALADTAQLEVQARSSYKELYHRQERAKKLRRVREELELRHNLRRKGRNVKVAEAENGKPAVFKWFPERKR